MSHKEEFEKISRQSIDLLINSTLKRHGIKLEKPEMTEQERKEIKSLIEGLKKNVESLTDITKK